jgi:hypothetical protein
MKSRRHSGAVTLLMLRELGDQPICRCGATMLNFDVACDDVMGEACPGWSVLKGTCIRVMRTLPPRGAPCWAKEPRA